LKKPIIDLNQFSHNREIGYRPAVDELLNLINQFVEQEELAKLFNHFYLTYDLPIETTQKSFKRSIATSYIYKKSSFNNKLSLKSFPKSMLNYGALFYACFFTKKNKKINQYQLIIDDLWSPIELSRLEKLLNLFGKENVLCIARSKEVEEQFSEYDIYSKKFFRDFNKIDLLKSLYKEIFSGVWLVLIASLKTRVNLFGISLQIIHNYLAYKALFDTNKAEYLIQPWHYDTSPIKNYLFKQSGGISTATIQKNIVEADLMFAYIDIDILFSYGNSGFQRLLEFDGRINKVKPVGSLFMEYHWFENPLVIEAQYDIIFMGINLTKGSDRVDKYEGFTDDYYSSFEWLVKIKNKNPQLKIGVKHHSSAGIEDSRESEILRNSEIIIVDKNLNSYQIAFSSHCVVTYGSSMGYELIGHNVLALFIDPGYRCAFLPEKENDNLGALRITSYEEFDESLSTILSRKNAINFSNVSKTDLCLESSVTSNNIFGHLKNII